MEAASVPQIEKRLYRNNTGGYLGVVVLDHKGEEQGVNIDPLGTIWLSDAEAILTARAPARPEDNPFEEREYIIQDPETQVHKAIRVRPLTLERDDSRYVPAQDRYVPIYTDDHEARAHVEAAAHGDEPGVVVREDKAAEVARAHAQRPPQEAPPAQPPGEAPASSAPPSAAQEPPPPPPAVAAATASPPVREEPRPSPQGLRGTSGSESAGSGASGSWVAEPEAPGQVIRGALAGSDEPSGVEAEQPSGGLPSPGVVPPQQAPPQPGAAPEEEHAAAVDPAIGEETGRASEPSGDPAQGEYARAEEVGSPDAPLAGEDEGLIGA